MNEPPEKSNENREAMRETKPSPSGGEEAKIPGVGMAAPRMAAPSGAAGLSDDQKKRLNEINEQLLKEMEQSISLLRLLKANIKTVSTDIMEGFTDTRIMYWLLFILGIALVVIAVPVALYTNKDLFSLLFGSAGVIDILAFFLKDPPLQLQKSRANLTKLQAAYYQWLVDMYNWSAVLYTQSQAGHLEIKDMKEASDSYIASFSAIMRAIDGDAQDTGTGAKGDKGTAAKGDKGTAAKGDKGTEAQN
jgi:hypothetical protein